MTDNPEPAVPRKRKKRPRRQRTPTLLQMEAVECGAAALGIVLGSYGRIVPLEELRVACGVSRDGSKASNMVKAARNYGLVAKGMRCEVESLSDYEMPLIVFWNFNHFVVLEGFGRNKVYLNDPAEGPRTVSPEEFDASFTGVVLDCRPGPDFEKGGRRPSLIAALGKRMKNSGTAFMFALIAGLALVVPGLLLPTFARVFVDSVLVARLEGWFRPLLVGLALTAIVRLVLTWTQQYYLLRLETKLSISTSSTFLWHIVRLPIDFYNQRYGGEISSRVGLNDKVANFLTAQLAGRAIDAMMVVFFALLMLTYDWVLTMIGVVAVVLIVLATLLVNRRRTDGNRRLLQEQGKATGSLMAGLSTIETLKASGSESDLFSRWAGYEAKAVNAQQELARVTQVFLTLPPLLIAFTNAGVLGLGAFRVMQGEMTMGMLVAFQSLMSSFLSPINNLVSLASNLQEMEGSMNRLDDVLRYDVDSQTAAAESAGEQGVGPKLSGNVEIDPRHFVRLLAPGSAAHRRLQLDAYPRGPRRPGGWIGERQVDDCQAGDRLVRALVGRGSVGRPAPRRHPAQPAHQLTGDGRPGHHSLRGHSAREPASSCSTKPPALSSATPCRFGTRRSPIAFSCRPPRTRASTTTSPRARAASRAR